MTFKTFKEALLGALMGAMIVAIPALFIFGLTLDNAPDDLPRPWPSQSVHSIPEQEVRTPANHEVVRWFTAMTEDGRVDYTSVTFTDGVYRYTCTVPGAGAGPASVPVCKLF